MGHISPQRPLFMVLISITILATPVFAQRERSAERNVPDPAGRPADGRASLFERVLQRFDANKDGKVTRDEFRGNERIFDRLDANRDGVITREEVQMPGRRPAGGDQRPADRRRRPDNGRRRPSGTSAPTTGKIVHLPQNHAYQKTLRNWLAGLTAADLKVEIKPFTPPSGKRTADEKFKTWLLTQVREHKIDSLLVPAEQFTLESIERPGTIMSPLQGDYGDTPVQSIAWLASWGDRRAVEDARRESRSVCCERCRARIL